MIGNTSLARALLDRNPHVLVEQCKAVLAEMELKVKQLRLRELRKGS
jgi:hypothetical protein